MERAIHAVGLGPKLTGRYMIVTEFNKILLLDFATHVQIVSFPVARLRKFGCSSMYRLACMHATVYYYILTQWMSVVQIRV